MDQNTLFKLICLGFHEAYEYKCKLKKQNCECGGKYLDIEFNSTRYKVCKDCGYLIQNFKFF